MAIIIQENYIKIFCEKFEINMKKIYIDDGFSGRDFNRPGISKIIKSKENQVILTQNFQ